MLPFALTITYALVASLLVSLTVVPTMGSLMLRRPSPKPIPGLTRCWESMAQFCASACG